MSGHDARTAGDPRMVASETVRIVRKVGDRTFVFNHMISVHWVDYQIGDGRTDSVERGKLWFVRVGSDRIGAAYPTRVVHAASDETDARAIAKREWRELAALRDGVENPFAKERRD